MKIDLFEESIRKMFLNLYRLIKPSDFKNKTLHPVIFTIGSRRFGEDGLYDMDYLFQIHMLLFYLLVFLSIRSSSCLFLIPSFHIYHVISDSLVVS